MALLFSLCLAFVWPFVALLDILHRLRVEVTTISVMSLAGRFWGLGAYKASSPRILQFDCLLLSFLVFLAFVLLVFFLLGIAAG